MTTTVGRKQGVRANPSGRVAILALASGMLVSIVGCTSTQSGHPSKPEGSVSLVSLESAIDRTLEARSARIVSDTVLLVPGLADGQLNVSAEGVFDLVQRRGKFTTQSGPSGPVEAIVGEAFLYVKLPSVGRGDEGKPWMRIDLDKTSQPGPGEIARGLAAKSFVGPIPSMEMLRGATDVSFVGDAVIRGAKVMQYTVRLDQDRVRIAAPLSDALAATKRILGSSVLTVDVWIDELERFRKIVLTGSLPSVASSSRSETRIQEAGSMRSTIELFEFGVAVDSTLPAADQVRLEGE